MFSILAATRPCIPVLIISCSVLPFQTRRLMRGGYKRGRGDIGGGRVSNNGGIKIKIGATSVRLCSFYNRFKLDLGLGQAHPQPFNITGSRALLLHKRSHFVVALGGRTCAFTLKSAQWSQAISFRQTVRKWQQRQLSPDKI